MSTAEQIERDRGMEYLTLAKSPVDVDATVSWGKQRLTFHGTVCIEKAKGSYKYNKGLELQLVLFSHDLPKLDTRAKNRGCSRIEINLPFNIGRALLEKALANLDDNIAKFM